MIKFIGTDTDEQGTVFMFQGTNIWIDFRLVEGTFIIADYGICSDWSSVE